MIDARALISRVFAIHLLLFLILFGRRPGTLTNAQFWAEDGAVFFAEQLRSGFFHSLSSTYAGYYHVIPRLVAGAASALPARYAPFAYNLTALAVGSICCGLFAWPICRHIIASDAVRMTACLIAATAVYAGDEVIGNITNLQWFLLTAALILLAYQETPEIKPAWVYVSLAFAGVLIALSAPLVLVLVPWLSWQIVRKKALARLPSGCMLAGTLFETFTFLVSNEPHTSLLKLKLGEFFVAVTSTEILRPILVTLLGHHYLGKGGNVGLASKFTAALITVSICLTRLYSSLDHRGRKILTVAIYVSLSLIAAVMAGRNLAAAFTDADGFRHLPGERYFFVPGFLFVFIAAFALDRALSTRKQMFTIAALLLLFGYGMDKNFKVPALHDLSWGRYADSVDDWAAKRNRGEHPSRLTVPINPVPFTIILE